MITAHLIPIPPLPLRRLHNERANVCRVVAFANGTLTAPVTLVARGLQDLLAQATGRLQMPFAARKLFNRCVGGSREMKEGRNCWQL